MEIHVMRQDTSVKEGEQESAMRRQTGEKIEHNKLIQDSYRCENSLLNIGTPEYC